MKEAIERLVFAYEKNMEFSSILMAQTRCVDQLQRESGKHEVCVDIVRELKGVLAQHETDNSNRANGNGTDDRGDGKTNQVETVRPG